MAVQYWLMKREVEQLTWSELEKDKTWIWIGIRNYQARDNLQAMNVGDKAFFYYVQDTPEVVGTMEIVEAHMDDPTDDSGVWAAVKVKPVEKFAQPVTLHSIKANPKLAHMETLHQERLSVSHVTPDEWDEICAMGKQGADA